MKVMIHIMYHSTSPTFSVTFLSQKSIKESIEAPEFVMTDFAKFDRPGQLHIAFQALHSYLKKKGTLPKPRSKVSGNAAN